MRFSSVIGETTGDVSYDDQIFMRLIDQETMQVTITMKFCYH